MNYSMKEFTRMTPQEQTLHIEKVDKFADGAMLRLLAKTEAWTDQDLKEYYDGVELLRAWRKYDPAIQQFRSLNPKTYITSLSRYINKVRENSPLGKMRTISANDKRLFYANVPKEQSPDKYGISPEYQKGGPVDQTWLDVEGRLPKELAAYKHLLSTRMQKESEKFPDLYSEFTYASEMAKNLAEKGSTKEDIATYTQRAVAAQNEISDLWEKIDIEKSGIEKKLREGETVNPNETADDYDPIIIPGKTKGSYTKKEIDQMKDPVFRTECRMARIDANLKYISRTDVDNTAKNRKKKRLRIEELEAWDIPVEEKYKTPLEEN